MTVKQIMEIENQIHELKMEAFRTVIKGNPNKDGANLDDVEIYEKLCNIEKEVFEFREWLAFKEKYNV